MPQGRLAHVLRALSERKDGRLLVGPDTFDDAGVVVLGREEGLPAGTSLHLVQTVDFFPPVVDDPYLYGAIAAANALSDVYAMGGRPISALTLASFPKDFPEDWLAAVLQGGFDKVHESGAAVVGGHTVEGAVQFGFACTGVVEREHLTANTGARAGDRLYLTKPLGMGTYSTAAKKSAIEWSEMEGAARQMATLNAAAAEAMVAAGAQAATDVTGFGLIGHAHNLARASGVTLAFDAARVPFFGRALELSAAGHNSGGAKRGRAHLGDAVELAASLDEALVRLLFDAETSGGLLIAIAPDAAATLERELALRDVPVCRVGEVEDRGEHSIRVR
ncbi:MAG TPA: selenide, water dikinase SelD [Planctomycetota bacterium]|nr:selenide, water dikinase SelD [Planctomycetota bacterium]